MMKRIIVDHNLRELFEHGSKSFPLWSNQDHYDQFYDRGYDPHWHESFEFVFLLEGKLSLQLNGETILVEKNETVFINRNVLHQGTALLPNTQAYVLIFDASLLASDVESDIYQNYIAPVLAGPTFLKMITNMNHLFSQIFKLYREQAQDSKLLIMPYLFELWGFVYQGINSHKKRATSSIKLDRLKVVLDFIHQNYAEDLSLKAIASSINLNISECSKLFKSYMQQSIFSYLIKYRVQMSTYLLKENHYTIQVISEMVGFNQVSYYIACFKRFLNQTPKQYQRSFNITHLSLSE